MCCTLTAEVSAISDMNQISTKLWFLMQQHSEHVTILCSWELAAQHGFVIYRCREMFLWLVKDLRGELRSSSAQLQNKADLWNVRERIMKPSLIFPIKCVFSKTFSCTVERHHGECVCVKRNKGDGTGLLLGYIHYCCHVLRKLARSALTK